MVPEFINIHVQTWCVSQFVYLEELRDFIIFSIKNKVNKQDIEFLKLPQNKKRYI